MTSRENVDWTECPIVETKPSVHNGAPVLSGTRMPVHAILDNFYFGVSVAEIAEQFEIPQNCISAVIDYAESRHIAQPRRQASQLH